MAEPIPFKYRNKNSNKSVPQITIKCTDADGKENKEECPIFTNGTQNKVLIQTIETIIVLGNQYDWKDGKEKLYYQNLGRALKGKPSKKWEGLIESVRNKTFENFKTKVIELIEEIMGEDAYKDQIKYLVDTPQPTNLSTAEWCDRVAVINAGLIYLRKGAKMMSEEDIIEKVITVNLKPELMRDFIMEKGDKATTLKEVKQILHRIDRANAHTKQAEEKLLKSKPKDSKDEKKEKESHEREKGGANMCRLKNHNHAWSECPNNPISKKFSDKLYTEIPASERYENDFTKKAKKLAKEEKETKKKVSIKNGKECHVMTPMVKIKHESDLDYLSDEAKKMSKTAPSVEVLKSKHLRPWRSILYARWHAYKTSGDLYRFYLFKSRLSFI